MQRAFFDVAPRSPNAARLPSAMHRSASAPAIRESVASWHLQMVVNAIGASPRHSTVAAAGMVDHHVSAVDRSVLSQ